MTAARDHRPPRPAAGHLWPWLCMVAALALSPRPTAAQDLEWQPLTAFDTTMRATIEAAATREIVGMFDFDDAAHVQVAFAELDEDASTRPANLPEIILRLAPEACTRYHCPIMALTYERGRYVELTLLRGPALTLGTAFHHGLRDLLVGGDRFWFTGTQYIYTGEIEGWRLLPEVDPATRAWIDKEFEFGQVLIPEPDPHDPMDVFVAVVDLGRDPSATSYAPRPAIVIIDRNACGNAGCSVVVYAVEGASRRRIGTFLGVALSLGTGFRHGLRDLVLDRRGIFTFDGTAYGWAGLVPEDQGQRVSDGSSVE
jgi:hypothetical protein